MADALMTYQGSDFYCDRVFSGLEQVAVVEDAPDVLAFEHTRPSWACHLVVVPKRHVPSLLDLGEGGETVLTAVMETVRRVAARVVEQHGACRVVTNLGAYQDSKHLHFHLLAGGRLR